MAPTSPWPRRGWTLALLTIILMGGGNWTMPLPGFVAQLTACAVIVCALGSRHSVLSRPMVGMDRFLIAVLGLIAVQLVPLPPALWHAFPGRDVARAIDDALLPAARWRPLTLDPGATLGALVALLPPLSIYLAIRTAPRARIAALLDALPIAFVASAIVAFAQLALGQRGWLRLYPLGDYDYPIGFFANHNHQAAFLACMLPLLALWLGRLDPATARARLMGQSADTVLLIAAGLVTALCLVTGSRTGVVLLVLSLAGTSMAWQRQSAQAGAQWIMRSLLPMGLIVLCIWLMTTNGVERLATPFLRGAMEQDQRWTFWRDVSHAAAAFWPAGSGLGTFVDAFAMHEPLISVSERYLNHAHNDYLDIALEAGLPGLIFVAAALWLTLAAAWRNNRSARSNNGARGGRQRMEVILTLLPPALIALHSFVDYPARTHAIGALALLCWALAANRIIPNRPREQHGS